MNAEYVKLARWAAFLLPMAITGASTAGGPPAVEEVNQVSTLGALSAGRLAGLVPASEMAAYGDFGLGTFHALDGEMVQIDGRVFQVLANGQVRPAPPDLRLPFFTSTFFDADQAFAAPPGLSLTGLADFLDERLPSLDVFYAIRLRGNFSNMRTRSVGPQIEPFPTLAEALAKQTEFDLGAAEGIAVGFRSPQYIDSLNARGYHFHFLDSKRSAGGHVLTFLTKEVTIEVDRVEQLRILLPPLAPSAVPAKAAPGR